MNKFIKQSKFHDYCPYIPFLNEPRYTLYLTTNELNGKIYVGVHKEHSTIISGYKGSGNFIEKAFSKYGGSNFSKMILGMYETEDEAYEEERLLVTKEFINSHCNYNATEGGRGGWRFNDELKREVQSKIYNTLKSRGTGFWCKELKSKIITKQRNENSGMFDPKFHEVQRERKKLSWYQTDKYNNLIAIFKGVNEAAESRGINYNLIKRNRDSSYNWYREKDYLELVKSSTTKIDSIESREGSSEPVTESI
jgi:hypothetical protein